MAASKRRWNKRPIGTYRAIGSGATAMPVWKGIDSEGNETSESDWQLAELKELSGVEARRLPPPVD